LFFGVPNVVGFSTGPCMFASMLDKKKLTTRLRRILNPLMLLEAQLRTSCSCAW